MEQLALMNQEYRDKNYEKQVIPQLQINPSQSFEKAISAILPSEAEENKTTKMRRLLGEPANNLTGEQIECIAAEFQFLIDTWLDEFERDIFTGKTLKEVLNEEG